MGELLDETFCARVLEQARWSVQQQGDRKAAATLARLRLQLASGPEHWSLLGRPVTAYRGALLAPQSLILPLREDAELRERVRASVRAAFETPDRILRDIVLTLDPQAVAESGADHEPAHAHPYRAPAGHPAPPSPGVLREASAVFARAGGNHELAELLERSRFVCEPTSPRSNDPRPCHRVLVQLGLEDLAALLRKPTTKVQLAAAVRAVGISPHHTVGEVTVGPMLAGVRPTSTSGPPVRHAAHLLQDLLAAEGIASVMLSDDGQRVRLLAVMRGEAAVVDVEAGSGWRVQQVELAHLAVGGEAPDPAGAARRIRAVLAKGRR